MSQAAALSLPQRDSTGGRRTSYRSTEFGHIPKDWEIVRLGQLAKFITSGSRGWAKYYSDTGAVFVRSQNVRSGCLDFTDQQYVTPPVSGEGTRTRICIGDILITITGNSVGNIASVNSEIGEAYISQHVGLVRLETPSQARFVTIFLAPGSIGNPQISGSQSGQSKPGLNLRNLEYLAIALPPLDEQLAIAEALSDADALIESLEQLIAKKRHIKQGAMQELLIGKTRLPGFSEEWETQPLEYIAPLQRGFDLPNSKLRQGHYPVVYSNGVLNHHAVFQVKGPGVVTGRSGTIGAVTFVEQHFWPHNTSLWVTTFKGNDPKFVFYLYTRIGLERFATGSGVPTLNRNDVHAFKVKTPALKAEQTAIATILSDMDTEIAALESKLAKSRQIKQGMMHNLLTGRIRLV